MEATSLKRRFSGHETFPLRFSWIPKAVRHLSEDPDLFSREDDFVPLGVGKNMAFSIRYWCSVLGITSNSANGGSPITPFASSVFSEGGLDPYMEDDTTLWLLHWMATRPLSEAGTTSLLFSSWQHPTFSRESLVDWLEGIDLGSRTPSRAVLSRDVGVTIGMYTRGLRNSRSSIEETFDSPLSELGLLVRQDTGKAFRFNVGKKPTLRPTALAAVLEDFWSTVALGQSTMKLDRIVHDFGSPGNSFKLSHSVLHEMIESMPAESGFTVSETAGVAVVHRDGKEESRFIEMLEGAYQG